MSAHQSALSLVVKNGPQAGQVFTLKNQPQTIGRGSGSDIILTDPTISRLHARLRPTPQGYIIENLSNSNPVLVNEQPVSGPTLLRSGDNLRLGHQMVLQVQGGAAGPNDHVETWMPRTAVIPADGGYTVIPDTTLKPGIQPSMPDSTLTPNGLAQTAYAPPQDNNLKAWLWMAVVVLITALAVGGGLGYLYLSREAAPLPTEAAPLPAATPLPTSTATPPPPSTGGATPVSTPLRVPGIALASAPEQPLPQDFTNLIDPWCNGQKEVRPDEPVAASWTQRLASPDGETDYVAQWLASAHYDLTLAGRPLNSLNYERTADGLRLWVNLGLLPPGKHYLSLNQFSSRPVSTGLDISPADGQMDMVEAGAVTNGFCEIIVSEPTAVPSATPTLSPTPSPTSAKATAPPVMAAAGPGVFLDFESQINWKRGDQPYGELTRSSAQVHSGSSAGQLSYNFPTADNDYVVFLLKRALGGRPNAFTVWVYGDNSGHFLNIWLKDAGGETWQMSFGPIKHTGWKELTAFIDPGQPWPSGHIDGPNNGTIEYPISFQGLVLDDAPDSYSGSGTIYIDDLTSKEGATPPTPTPARPQVAIPTTVIIPMIIPTATPVPAPVVSGLYVLQLGGQHRYEEPWGAPRSGDPCEAWRNDSWDDRNANFRGFNVELFLANYSTFKVSDDWGENMRFITSGGREVKACYYGYAGAGPPPGGATSLTFFSVVPKGEFVQMMELNLNGQVMRLCLDGRGGASGC